LTSILLIEDDHLFRETLANALTERGFAVTQAADGEAGVKLFRVAPTDLVITDIVMPNKEGIALVVELHRDFPKLGIIAMSGGAARDPALYLKLAGLFGANRTLPKPFTIDALLGAIQGMLAETGKGKPAS